MTDNTSRRFWKVQFLLGWTELECTAQSGVKTFQNPGAQLNIKRATNGCARAYILCPFLSSQSETDHIVMERHWPITSHHHVSRFLATVRICAELVWVKVTFPHCSDAIQCFAPNIGRGWTCILSAKSLDFDGIISHLHGRKNSRTWIRCIHVHLSTCRGNRPALIIIIVNFQELECFLLIFTYMVLF